MSDRSKYCSQCYWSTNDPNKFPPRWYCMLQGGAKRVRINSDEQATKCEWYVKINVNGGER